MCCYSFVSVVPDISNSSFVQFQVWDIPGQIDFFDPTFDSDMIFGGCGSLIFVIDAQVCNTNRGTSFEAAPRLIFFLTPPFYTDMMFDGCGSFIFVPDAQASHIHKY